ncbi:unnamed protein product [Cylindrotheca closterium]|uniref:HSF-type DNA-binding domain-containing protein n=1 Tax=Cylindrotheca closterium TaxID=2856 RepID=A0AAD2CK51_9STRA|nr:unnamed protein product [Cylindrotheca closterium]
MCNPNSTIAAFRRRARAQQLLELQTGAVNAQYLMANSLNESALANQARETVPTRTVQTDNNSTMPTGKAEYTGPSYGIPTTFSALQSYQLARSAIPTKPKPKRRRKPQKPGKTAKQNDRHFVVHDYHDHANDTEEYDQADPTDRRGGVSISFPIKLHAILDQVEADGLSHIISWQPHGRCFVIHKPKEFADHVMPGYFRQTKLTSFQRQLNLYGFNRITRGDDSGGYYHELFLRGKTFLCNRMVRTKVKGTRFKAASSPEREPNFYLMPPVKSPMHVTPQTSDCDNSDDGYPNQMYAREAIAPTPFASSPQQEQDVWRQSYQEQLPQAAATIVENSSNYSPLATMSRSLIHPGLAAARLPSPAKYQMPPMLPNQNSLDDNEISELLLDSFSQDSVNNSVQQAVDFSNIFDPIGDNALSSDAELSRVLCRLLD